MRADRTPSSQFTLIELLVTVAIIGILASMLLPALTKAKQAAIQTKCINSERQMGMIATLYTESHSGYLPPTLAHAPGTSWARTAHDYLAPFLSEGWDGSGRTEHAPALYDAYLSLHGLDIMICPAVGPGGIAKSAGTIPQGNYHHAASYGMTAWANWTLDTNGDTTNGPPSRISRHSPDQIFMADGWGYGSINVLLWPTIYGVYPERHSMSVGYLFFDGHVSHRKDHYINGASDWSNPPWRSP